jgi:hypothetical protein
MLKKLMWLAAMFVFFLGGKAEAGDTYSVRPGDSLSRIAKQKCGDYRKYGRIADDNGIVDPYVIHPGQRLVVNCSPQAVEQAPAQAARVEVTGPKVQMIDTMTFVTDDSARTSSARVIRPDHTVIPTERIAPKTSLPGDPTRNEIIDAIFETFGPVDGPKAAAIFEAESGLILRNQGWNCRYNGRSRACYPGDRPVARSVDCGIAQINAPGELECPAEYWTLAGNLAEAKRRYNEGGWNQWISYRKGQHRQFMAKYENYEVRTLAQAAPKRRSPVTKIETMTFVTSAQNNP